MTLVISHNYISKFYSYAIDCSRRVACRRAAAVVTVAATMIAKDSRHR